MALLNRKLLLNSLLRVKDTQSVEAFVNQLDLEISAGSSGTATQITATISAIDTFAAFDPATIGGKKADSGNTAYYGKVIGISSTAIASGFAGVIVAEGLVTNSGWSWTPGAAIFLNGTSLSQTAPSNGFSQEMGVAKTSTTMFVDPSVPILL